MTLWIEVNRLVEQINFSAVWLTTAVVRVRVRVEFVL